MSQARPDQPGGAGAAPPEKPSDHYIKIPAKYSNPKTSTYTVAVKPGRQVINIDLTD